MLVWLDRKAVLWNKFRKLLKIKPLREREVFTFQQDTDLLISERFLKDCELYVPTSTEVSWMNKKQYRKLTTDELEKYIYDTSK